MGDGDQEVASPPDDAPSPEEEPVEEEPVEEEPVAPPPQDPASRRSSPLRALSEADPAWWVLAAMVLSWIAVFGPLVWLRHHRVGSFGFDMGIFDQAVWLLSRFGDQLITVRGLTVFGHHAEPALYLFAPFYWLGAGPHFLNLVQVTTMAGAAVPLFLVARDRLGGGWIALPVCAAYLLHPSLQYMAWELFHPEVMAIAPLFLAYWFSLRRRWGWFAASLVLAVAWKEDVTLAAAVLGLLVALRGDRRVGLLTTGLSLAWFLFTTRVMLPYFSGSEAFYNQFFGELGGSVPEMAANALRDPSLVTERLLAADARTYLWKMLMPFGFVPLAGAGPLLAGVPQTLVNLLSVNDFTRKITFHYAALPLAGLSLGAVEGIRWLGRRPGMRRFLVGWVAAAALTASALWGPSPIGQEFRRGWWVGPGDERLPAKRAALASVPHDAGVSATYLFVAQLTHRHRIYEFPNPFRPRNWGVRDENYPPATAADWLVVDRQLLGDEDEELFESLLDGGEFRVVSDRDDVVVARRS